MKKEEIIAKGYLEKRFNSIEYEPDGNVPPDFLLDQKIAVEVRRLNENRNINNQKSGIEQLQFITSGIIERINKKIKYDGTSYYIEYNLQETNVENLKKALKGKLIEIYKNKPKNNNFTIEGVEFKVHQNIKHKTPFVLGGFIDYDEEGWELDAYSKNLKMCIKEKNERVTKNSVKQYSEWWLLLVDYIVPASMRSNLDNILTINKMVFNKVILIDMNGRERLSN